MGAAGAVRKYDRSSLSILFMEKREPGRRGRRWVLADLCSARQPGLGGAAACGAGQRQTSAGQRNPLNEISARDPSLLNVDQVRHVRPPDVMMAGH